MGYSVCAVLWRLKYTSTVWTSLGYVLLTIVEVHLLVVGYGWKISYKKGYLEDPVTDGKLLD
jgi:hypothetical protein